MDIRKLSKATAEKLKSNPQLIKLDALASAFALIATADGNVDHMEASKFFSVIEGIDDLQHVPTEQVKNVFDAAIETISKNGESGTDMALNAVSAAKGNSDNIELILSASQAAIVADGHLKDAEDQILRQICTALGVDPDSY